MSELEGRVPPGLFEAVVRKFASAAIVVTAVGDSGPVAVRISSFSHVSFDPPLVLVCISRSLGSHMAFVRAQSWGVSALSAVQATDERLFGANAEIAGPELSTIEGAATGVPLLVGATAYLECIAFDRHPAGDSVILVGEVAAAGHSDVPPLLHFDGRYVGLRPL